MTSRRSAVLVAATIALVVVLSLWPLRPTYSVDWWRLILPAVGGVAGYFAGKAHYRRAYRRSRFRTACPSCGFVGDYYPGAWRLRPCPACFSDRAVQLREWDR